MKKFTRYQIGQATTEYIVISLIIIAALGVPFGDEEEKRSVVTRLSDMIKQEYRAYKYAHSVGNLP
ncbi:MAG: hypothetical protein KUG78_05135 [Kangiellaceae bacterium]|nr:hypothetical protein [Kangiellaceae bacterium]